MPSCQHIARLFADRAPRKLTFGHRLQITFHLVFCSNCRRRCRRIRLLERLYPRHFAVVQMDLPAGGLSDETREKIRSALQPPGDARLDHSSER